MTRAVVLALALVAAGAAPAFGDSHAEAVVLFDQGIKDMKAGRLDKACPELQASLDLVKDSGTKGALARCHGLAGRVATAWLLWRELTDTAPSAELRADAAAQATRLEPRLPRYTIKLAGATPKLTVQINGRDVATNVPVPVPIDPGKLLVSASGRDGDRILTETWSRPYTAVEGETVVIEIPVLGPRVVAVTDPARPGSAELADRRRTRRVIALVLGGVALGGAVGGAVLGLDARSKYSDATRQCGGAIKQCVPDQVASAQHRVDQARTAATRSTVVFGAAGAAAVAAAIVWFTAPSLERKAVTVAPAGGDGALGLVLGGVF